MGRILRVTHLLRSSGVCLFLLGTIGILVSTGESQFLAEVWGGGLLMVFNTALCFCLIALGFLALSLNRIKITIACSLLIAVMACGVLLEYALGRPLGIDQLFWVQSFPASMPGRMGLNTAVALAATAGALGLMALRPKSMHRLIPALAGGLFGLSIIAFLGFFAGLRPSLTQGYFTMTLSAATGFALIATTLLIWIRLYHPRRNAVILLGAMGIIMLLSLGIVSLLSSETFDSANQWVRHSFAVREKLQQISTAVSNDRDTWLQKRGERKNAEELVRMVSDNPSQTQRAKQLQQLIRTIPKTLETQSSRFIDGISSSNQTEKLQSEIHDVINAMLEEEERLLQKRSEKTDQASKQVRKLSITGGILAAALLAMAIGLLGYAERKRHKAETGLIKANKELRAANALAEESTRLKAQFLANMSHEIRTPMNGVVGMTELLLDTRLSSEQRMFADTVRSSANTLLAVLNDILDFSKIEAGQLLFNKEPFDLREPIENCLGILSKQAHTKGLELAYLLEEGVPNQLVGDANRLGQVLLNLAGNAVKFTSKGEVVLRVAKVGETVGSVKLRFTVTDTGLGISLEDQSKLFQPFVQVDGKTARKFGGTGLGLAICRQLVQLMEGQIGLESEPGKGSTFWFVVPFRVQKATPKVILPEDTLAGLRGLIVDDNATNREILLRQFAGWRIEGEAVKGGPQALHRLKANAEDGLPFDFAILDMNMPEMDGVELARAIRAVPELKMIKLLLLTSMGQMLADEDLKAVGIDAILIKPARHAQLQQRLSTLVSHRTAKGATADLASTSTFVATDAKLRILVAEDNHVNQHVIRLQLERLGYQPVLVDDGTKAIAAAQTKAFDVIFMDCQMPEVDGLEATRKIRDWERARRSMGEHFAAIHIVAMTANAMVGDREACLAAGMNDYLAKPVRPAAIVEALARSSAA